MFPTVLVAGSLCSGAGSVRYVQPNVNGCERNKPITNVRISNDLLNKKAPYFADNADGKENMGIPSVRNAAKNVANSRIENGKDGITKKALNVAVYPNGFVF
jgi:hypothetical protein